jgi:hypothetical protein
VTGPEIRVNEVGYPADGPKLACIQAGIGSGRPVFEAAPPGTPISPDLAGRMAADFALGAQLAAGRDHARGQYLLGLA